MKSRYEKIHGSHGLCTTLMELFNAMAELRMKALYSHATMWHIPIQLLKATTRMIRLAESALQLRRRLDAEKACTGWSERTL